MKSVIGLMYMMSVVSGFMLMHTNRHLSRNIMSGVNDYLDFGQFINTTHNNTTNIFKKNIFTYGKE